MRIVVHENERKRSRIGTATAVGRISYSIGLYKTGSGKFLRRLPAERPTLDKGVSGAWQGRFESQTPARPTADTFCGTGTASFAMVSPLAAGVRFFERTLDSAAGNRLDLSQVSQKVSSALHQSVVGRSPRHVSEAPAAGTRTERQGSASLVARGVAADKKIARRRRAHLVLIDESGFLMSPVVRRTLAPCGRTPILKTKTAHREKVSITAALTISPKRYRLGLYWRTYPKSFVNAQRAADFLRYLLRHLRGAVMVVWDGGPMHNGEPIRQVRRDFPRLSLERLPPYAPELNPVEYLWSHLKYGQLSNFIPDNVFQLDAVLNDQLCKTRNSPKYLSGFFHAAGLPFL